MLFDFVYCNNLDNFENPEGEFDIIQPFPRMSMKECKEKEIVEVFQDSTMVQLIVSEL
jgi:hypothetical protein